jgi:hypothetical protein
MVLQKEMDDFSFFDGVHTDEEAAILTGTVVGFDGGVRLPKGHAGGIESCTCCLL